MWLNSLMKCKDILKRTGLDNFECPLNFNSPGILEWGCNIGRRTMEHSPHLGFLMLKDKTFAQLYSLIMRIMIS